MSYFWVYLSLMCAFSLASSDALLKRFLTEENELFMTWLRFVISVPLICVVFYLSVQTRAWGYSFSQYNISGSVFDIRDLDMEFYRAFFLALPLEIAAIILYVRALRLSPLSMTLPFLSFTPLFLIIVSYIILGEKVSYSGMMGVLLIVVGSYILNIREFRKGIFEPFKAIFREKGSIMMIGVALIYSITASLGKAAIEHSSPLFFATTYFTAVTLLFVPLVALSLRGKVSVILNKTNIINSILPGLFFSIMLITHMIAVSLINVAYMISIKRLSLLIGVLFGFIFFKEKGIAGRFAGAVFMFSGFVLIVTSA